jgi:hypothetical protein
MSENNTQKNIQMFLNNYVIKPLCILTLATTIGCAKNNNILLPEQRTYSSIEQIASVHMSIMQEDCFVRRANHNKIENLITIIDSYEVASDAKDKEKLILEKMRSGLYAKIFNLEPGNMYHGFDKAATILENILENKGLDEKNKKTYEEEHKTLDTIRKYLNNLSPTTGLPTSDFISKKYSNRMIEEKERCTNEIELKDNKTMKIYNNSCFYDEMKAIDLSVVLHAAERFMINNNDHITAIQFCDVIKEEQNKNSYLFPQVLVLQGDAYLNLKKKLRTDPGNTMIEMDKKDFTKSLLERINEDINNASSEEMKENLKNIYNTINQPSITRNGFNYNKNNIIQDLMEKNARQNYEMVVDFYGASPQGKIANTKLLEMYESQRSKQTIDLKILD